MRGKGTVVCFQFMKLAMFCYKTKVPNSVSGFLPAFDQFYLFYMLFVFLWRHVWRYFQSNSNDTFFLSFDVIFINLLNHLLIYFILALYQTRTTRRLAFWGYPPPLHDYPYYWFILDTNSKQDKVTVTYLKNLQKLQIFYLSKKITHDTQSEVAW